MKTTEHRRTLHFNIMLIALAIVGLVAAVVAIDPMAWASQKSPHDQADHRGNGDVATAICDRRHDSRMAGAGIYLESILKLDAMQKKARDQVERDFGQGLAHLRDVCGNLASDAVSRTMPERLAFMEIAMAAGTETLRAVRPAFEVFYGTLDEHQRQKIDEMSRRHDSEVRWQPSRQEESTSAGRRVAAGLSPAGRNHSDLSGKTPGGGRIRVERHIDPTACRGDSRSRGGHRIRARPAGSQLDRPS